MAISDWDRYAVTEYYRLADADERLQTALHDSVAAAEFHSTAGRQGGGVSLTPWDLELDLDMDLQADRREVCVCACMGTLIRLTGVCYC